MSTIETQSILLALWNFTVKYKFANIVRISNKNTMLNTARGVSVLGARYSASFSLQILHKKNPC